MTVFAFKKSFFALFLSLLSLSILLLAEADFTMLSVPKCGTHLLVECLKGISEKTPYGIPSLSFSKDPNIIDSIKSEGKFIYAHGYSKEQRDQLNLIGYKVLFIYRDPRDQLISLMYWLKYLPEYPPSKIQDTNNIIHELITGNLYGMPAYETYYNKTFVQLKDFPLEKMLMIKFEDLVGSKGGGDDDIQHATILEIANFLEIELSLEKAKEIGISLWGSSMTFRKGKIGQWKDYFTPQHIELYKERYQSVLIELKYDIN